MAVELEKLAKDLETEGWIKGALVLRRVKQGLLSTELIPERMQTRPLELGERINVVGRNLGDKTRLSDLVAWDSKDYKGPQEWVDLMQQLTYKEKRVIRRGLYLVMRHLAVGQDSLGDLRNLADQEIATLMYIGPKTLSFLTAGFKKPPTE